MEITLPLEEMTVREKLALMETLWEDLARTPEAIESPAWHKGYWKSVAQSSCRFLLTQRRRVAEEDAEKTKT
jgi:hypothetical protein